MTFDQYILLCHEAYRQNTAWRVGQSYFNTLVSVRPDISEKLRATEVDPFYNTDRLPRFLEEVANLWDTES